MRYGEPLPAGTVTFMVDHRSAYNTCGMRVCVNVKEDGVVEVWSEGTREPLLLAPGQDLVIDVSVRPESAKDVMFCTKLYVIVAERPIEGRGDVKMS